MQQRDEQADEAKAVHLNAFLTKIYSTTGWGVLGLLGSAQLLTVSGLAFAMPMPLLGVGLVGGIGSSMAMAKMAPMYTAVPGEGLVAVDSAARKAAYAGLVGSFGCLAAPMFGLVSLSNPTIIPAAAVASIATMSGAALYALNAGMGKDGEAISAWGPALTGGLFGLIGVGVGGMGCSYLGYHEAAAALHSFSTYGGVVLFAGLTAYDTRVQEAHGAECGFHKACAKCAEEAAAAAEEEKRLALLPPIDPDGVATIEALELPLEGDDGVATMLERLRSSLLDQRDRRSAERGQWAAS